MYEHADEYDYLGILRSIRRNGFDWGAFRDVFPFGYLGIREGDYAELVEAALDGLPDDRQQKTLLDLLDAQWCVFIEQIWIANEFGGDIERFSGDNHFAMARLQIDDNIRRSRSLPGRNGRDVLLGFGPDDTVFGRVSGISDDKGCAQPGERKTIAPRSETKEVFNLSQSDQAVPEGTEMQGARASLRDRPIAWRSRRVKGIQNRLEPEDDPGFQTRIIIEDPENNFSIPCLEAHLARLLKITPRTAQVKSLIRGTRWKIAVCRGLEPSGSDETQ